MNLAEILDELGSRQPLGIVRVSSIQFPPIVGDSGKALGFLPVFQTFIGLGYPGCALAYYRTGNLHGRCTAQNGFRHAFPGINASGNGKRQARDSG